MKIYSEEIDYMRKIIEIKHHSHDYECMWNGIEDLYINKTGECLPNDFSFTVRFWFILLYENK